MFSTGFIHRFVSLFNTIPKSMYRFTSDCFISFCLFFFFIYLCNILCLLTFFFNSEILLNSFTISKFSLFLGIKSFIDNSLLAAFKVFHGWSLWSSIVFIYFSNVFPKEENVNLACFITLLWSWDCISSPVRYSYLSILPDNNADIL